MKTKIQAPTFKMVGTERTGRYRGIVTAFGDLGYRNLGGGEFRVRIEPADAKASDKLAPHFTEEQDWKQPGDDGEFRFSTVVKGRKTLQNTLKSAMEVMLSTDTVLAVSKRVPGYHMLPLAAVLIAMKKSQLVDMARELKLPGANGASNWKLKTLVAKVHWKLKTLVATVAMAEASAAGYLTLE